MKSAKKVRMKGLKMNKPPMYEAELLIRNWSWFSDEEPNRFICDVVFIDFSNDKILEDFQSYISKFINGGAKYFVFVGDLAESAHDLADDVILERSDYIGIITTFFFSEDLDEAVQHFVSIAPIGRESRKFLAIVNNSSENGVKVVNLLQNTFDASR